MLDCAPDGMAGVTSSLTEESWDAAWDVESAIGDCVLLRSVVATHNTSAKALFQPERMSGYCAAS